MNTKKHLRLRPLTLACVGMLTFASSTPAIANSGPQAPLNIDELEQVATEDFHNTASIMVDGYEPASSTHSSENRSNKKNSIRNKTFEQAVDSYRQELAAMGETYYDARTKTSIDSFTVQSNGTVKALATETTYLTISKDSTQTGYTALHELVFAPLPGGEWVIIDDQYLEPTGLLPLGEAELLVAPTAEHFDGLAAGDSIDNVAPAATTRLDKGADNDMKGVLRAGGYNYNAMADYLEKYWSNYNPAYRSFAGAGGDCTNFVSQALRAGGWKDKPGWYRNANYWWYTNLNQSRSWTAVDYWATFARNSGRTSMLSNVWQLRKGDVLQVKPKDSNRKTHTMMVSYYSNGTPYFTYHTHNRYRRSMNQVLLDWKGATFYAYRT